MGHALDFDDTLDTGGSTHSRCLRPRPRCSRRPIASGVSAAAMSCWPWRWGRTCPAASTREHFGPRLGPHRHMGVRLHSGGGQADRVDAGTDAARPRDCLQRRVRNRQSILDGALTKRLQAGQAASAGALSAALAQTGFTGVRFQRPLWLLQLYQPNDAVVPVWLGASYRNPKRPLSVSRPVSQFAPKPRNPALALATCRRLVSAPSKMDWAVPGRVALQQYRGRAAFVRRQTEITCPPPLWSRTPLPRCGASRGPKCSRARGGRDHVRPQRHGRGR